MSTIHTIYAGEGDQAVEVYPVDSLGREARASSVTVRIVDLELHESDAAREILAETAATIDATSTVLTAAAGPREADPRKISVASAAGIVVGRKYALTLDDGRTEVVEVDRVEGLDVYASAPLLAAFPATTSTLVGLRCSATFPGAVADDPEQLERPAIFGVDWVVEGVTGPPVVRTLVRIERRGRLPRATRGDVLQIDPQLQQAQHVRGSIERALRQADEEIDALLLHAGYNLAESTHGLVASMAVRWRAVELVYQSLGAEHEGRADRARTEAQLWAAKLTDGSKRDDTVEVSRATDAVRPRRTRRMGRLTGV